MAAGAAVPQSLPEAGWAGARDPRGEVRAARGTSRAVRWLGARDRARKAQAGNALGGSAETRRCPRWLADGPEGVPPTVGVSTSYDILVSVSNKGSNRVLST